MFINLSKHQTMRVLALGYCLLLSAFATSDPADLILLDNAKGILNATPCCTSKSEVLLGAKALKAESFALERTARHFDFGAGLAPCLAFRLTEDARVIETEAALQLVGFVLGGDGISRYVDVRVLFFDAGFSALTAKTLDSSQAFRDRQRRTRSLFSYVEVPKGAAFAVITTDPQSNGKLKAGIIRNRPEVRLTSRSSEFFTFGGVIPTDFKLANYGSVFARVLPNE